MKMNTLDRVKRHVNIMRKSYSRAESPLFLTLFINSLCNMKCEHCFYWQALNGKDDLTRDEIFALSRSLGKIETLNLSGGEPFLRKEFAEICLQFIRHNGVRQIYVPSNGYFKDRTVKALEAVLEEKDFDLFVVELSLDGMPEFHDTFRVAKDAFKKAMETYDALVELQKRDPRLRIHAISTATSRNMDEIRHLTTYLYDRCPNMDHHNLGLIRGDRKDPTLQGPGLRQYGELFQYIRRLWAPREEGRYGGIVEPLLQRTKIETVQKQAQVVPCRAGVLSGVVYANGDVSVCENHTPLGNLRQKSFPQIWNSPDANQLRESIACKNCWCTGEIAMWTSIVYQPLPLARALLGARAWQKTQPLGPGERAVFEPPTFSAPGSLVQVQLPDEI